MKFPLRALALLVAASFWVGRAAAAVAVPITVTTSPPALVQVSGTQIQVQSSGAAANMAQRAVNVGRVVAPAANDAVAAGIGAGGTAANEAAIMAVTDSAVAAGPAGELAVSMTEVAGADGMATAIIGCLASVVCAAAGLAVAGVGLAVHAYCQGGACKLDDGIPAPVVGNFKVDDQWHDSGATADAACAGFYSHLPADVTPTGTGGGSCGFRDSDRGYPGPSVTNFGPSAQCPVVNGVQPPAWTDGNGNLVCPSQGANTDPDPQALVKATSDYVKANTGAGISATTDAVAGGTPLMVTPYAITGPASQTLPATTTTTTAPDGTVTQAVATPSVSYHYSPAAIDIDTGTSTATTTTAPDGTTTKTTTVVGVVPDPSGQGTITGSKPNTDPSENPDLCALHPDALACDTLGTPGTDAPQWSSPTVTFAPEDLGLPAGCPAPRTFSVHGWSFAITYQPVCDVAPMISAGLVALTGLSCVLWIFGAIKG